MSYTDRCTRYTTTPLMETVMHELCKSWGKEDQLGVKKLLNNEWQESGNVSYSIGTVSEVISPLGNFIVETS